MQYCQYIRACHEPGTSSSESMSLFSHYTVSVFFEQIYDDDDDEVPGHDIG